MWTFIFLFIFVVYMVLTPILLLPYLLIYPFSRIVAKNYIAQLLSSSLKTLLPLMRIRLHVKGLSHFPKDPHVPVLLIGNHQSVWDIAVLLAVAPRPIGFISKKEVIWIFPLAIWMKALGCLFIDRKSPRLAMKTLQKGEKALQNGDIVAVFPEGKRSRGAEMGEFKRGSFKMAINTKANILPVTISGTYKAWEEKGSRIQPANMYLTFHPLLSLERATPEELEALPEITWEIIHKDLVELRSLNEPETKTIKGAVLYE